LTLLLLLLDTKFSLQPTLCRLVFISLLVLLELREKGRNARDGCCLSVFRRVVRWRKESETGARREQRQEIRGELVRHLSDASR
jgi:hypothetical protein